MKIRCVQCGREFELSQNEIDFYYSKGLDLPKRCKSCRDKNSGKYIVTYSEKHNINLFFFAIFLAFAAAVAYFDFADDDMLTAAERQTLAKEMILEAYRVIDFR